MFYFHTASVVMYFEEVCLHRSDALCLTAYFNEKLLAINIYIIVNVLGCVIKYLLAFCEKSVLTHKFCFKAFRKKSVPEIIVV